MLNKNEFDQIPIPENIDDVIDKGVTRAVKIKKRTAEEEIYNNDDRHCCRCSRLFFVLRI